METTKQKSIRDFVTRMHGNQKRKYTGEPYVSHVFEVGMMAQEHNIEFGLEIGFLHDVIEDTECTVVQMLDFLINIGYSDSDALFITSCVDDLTDVFTKESYPKFNREKRKKLEAARMGCIRFASQSVKYCDLIDNTKSICKHDPSFAKTYLSEKKDILKCMVFGNRDLFDECEKQISLLSE